MLRCFEVLKMALESEDSRSGQQTARHSMAQHGTAWHPASRSWSFRILAETILRSWSEHHWNHGASAQAFQEIQRNSKYLAPVSLANTWNGAWQIESHSSSPLDCTVCHWLQAVQQFRRLLMLVVLFVNGWVPWRTAMNCRDEDFTEIIPAWNSCDSSVTLLWLFCKCSRRFRPSNAHSEIALRRWDWDPGESEKPVPAAPCADKRTWPTMQRPDTRGLMVCMKTMVLKSSKQRDCHIMLSFMCFLLWKSCPGLETFKSAFSHLQPRPHSYPYWSPPLPNLQKQRSGSKGSGTRKEQKQWPGMRSKGVTVPKS